MQLALAIALPTGRQVWFRGGLDMCATERLNANAMDINSNYWNFYTPEGSFQHVV